MNDPLTTLTAFAPTCQRAVQLACVLEATAPKPGNVFPGASFADLTFADFATASEITARCLTRCDQSLGTRMLVTVQETCKRIGSNVNLGIVLLLGPLVEADRLCGPTAGRRCPEVWLASIKTVLDGLDDCEGGRIYDAIRHASPGGLGTTDSMDVQQTSGPVDLVAAMTSAADRDRIARQYASGFGDLLTNVVPVLSRAIELRRDVLQGICVAQLELLASEPDSLIARKNGDAVARSVQDAASRVDPDDPNSISEFDRLLRADGNKKNPGTTADLIAASMFVLLRSRGGSIE